MMSENATDGGEPVDQIDLELDPAAHDSSGNPDLASLSISPTKLFEQALEQTRMAVAISDPHAPDAPLIYVNQAFIELTGYAREEAIGRNCRFLQGPDTDPAARDAIRRAIEEEEVRVVEILNYRKDGSTFWNSLHVGPIYDKSGRLTHFYGSQWNASEVVAKRKRIALQESLAKEMLHRTGNLFGVIASIVRLSARGETDAAALAEKVDARIQALGRAHRISLSHSRVAEETTDLKRLILTILEPYANDRAERIALSGDATAIPAAAVTPIGLMVHELATNAIKYGALSAPEGRIAIDWTRAAEDGVRLVWTETGGPAVEGTPVDGLGTGSRIVEGVLRGIGASIDYDWSTTGLSATLVLPAERRTPR